MPELANYLKGYFNIPDTDLTKITTLFTKKTIKKGDFFVKKGHYANELSFVRQGYIRIYDESATKQVTQWIATKGFFLTDLRSLVFDEVTRWNMVALTDCEFYSISKSDYQKIGTLIPNWYELEKRFLAKCFITIEERVFDFISATAEERYQHLFHQNPELFNAVPLQYLASMLGMTPETLSRIRAKKLN